ncbi:chaperone NapD [Noviherbaspirillum aridicola]|uniref:Chaperone NapD n=1 Tax=Noviherbaspirillum aridicola TaxID=2849687 RepID=A0ABQ4Q349_9BURK|nr:chaperone NapD [Noviherbaspirillum aridicola]GIZ51569.1 glutamate synthase subunit beta [Noviherbaspirillum aridicola]
MEAEIHIASVVVYVLPAERLSVRSCIEAVPGADIHGEADGKLIVTLETESTKKTLDIMDAIRALPGVADVVLVYQHAELASALEQEVQQ